MEKKLSFSQQRRMKRLLELIDEVGNASAISRDSGTQKSHISAMANGKRGLGDKLAQKFERIYSKPEGWFDRPESSTTNIGNNAQVTVLPIRSIEQAIDLLGAALIASPDWGTKKMTGTVSDWAEDPTNERKKRSMLDLFSVIENDRTANKSEVA